MNLANYVEAASTWEHSQALAREKSERRAWFVAVAATAVALLAVAAVAALTPLKVVVPFLVSIDKASGETQVVAVLDPSAVVHNDLVDRYWVMNYVRARERYDWGLLQYDYDAVIRLSDRQVAKQYAALYQGENALDKRFGNSAQMRVDILSVTLPSGEAGKAVVRFDRSLKHSDQDSPEASTRFVATLAFRYQPTLRGRERDLIENPLGFQVTAYTVDQELIDAPRVESPASSSVVSNGSAISTGEQPSESLDRIPASAWHSLQEGAHSAAPEVRR